MLNLVEIYLLSTDLTINTFLVENFNPVGDSAGGPSSPGGPGSPGGPDSPGGPSSAGEPSSPARPDNAGKPDNTRGSNSPSVPEPDADSLSKSLKEVITSDLKDMWMNRTRYEVIHMNTPKYAERITGVYHNVVCNHLLKINSSLTIHIKTTGDGVQWYTGRLTKPFLDEMERD